MMLFVLFFLEFHGIQCEGEEAYQPSYCIRDYVRHVYGG